jgi:hypothetical protein
MKQVSQFWRAEDGVPPFENRPHALRGVDTLDALFNRMQFLLDDLSHMTEISRDLQWQSDLDIGTCILRRDPRRLRAGRAHTDDFYEQDRVHRPAELPITTLEERLTKGEVVAPPVGRGRARAGGLKRIVR